MFNETIIKKLKAFQKSEITEYHIYKNIASRTQNTENKEILNRIASEEMKHYGILAKYTSTDVKPDKIKIWFYSLIAKVLGKTFGIKLMEMGEEKAAESYREIASVIPEVEQIFREEEEHEKNLIGMIDEERLKYVGSMVLGLNDALVELTGALAGFTLALQNVRLIAVTGLITGVAASLSMAASEYLATKTENYDKNPAKASFYTGIAYIFAVVILVCPYFIFKNVYLCLTVTVFNAIILILAFSFYISVAKDLSFKKRFFEMMPITIGISALTFGIGFIVSLVFNVVP
ncbi:MAG: rubrerythrin family protein [Elusimicrobia bacterium]|nr:rubrerythrin family protein [Elusimicrobiota bacterium]